MKKGLIIGLSLVAIASISAVGYVVYKNKFSNKHSHQAETYWSYNDTYHWHKCKDDDGTIFNQGTHTLIANGSQKKCSICDWVVNYTTEENFAYWLAGRDDVLNITDNYSTFLQKEEKSNDTITSQNSSVEERSGNKYYYEEKKYKSVDNELKLESETVTAVKVVDDNGVERTKLYNKTITHNEEDDIQISGKYVATDYAKDNLLMVPSDILKVAYVNEGSTYDNLISNIKENLGSNAKISFERNNDNSVSLKIQVSTMTNTSAYNASITDNFEYIVKNGKLIGVKQYNTSSYLFKKDVSKNYSSETSSIYNYTYNDFDNAHYNSISVETETTEDYTN